MLSGLPVRWVVAAVLTGFAGAEVTGFIEVLRATARAGTAAAGVAEA